MPAERLHLKANFVPDPGDLRTVSAITFCIWAG